MVGDNEPYDGALAGDTIDAIATSRGLANALIEIRQDLIADKAGRAFLGRGASPACCGRSSPTGKRRAPADLGSRTRRGAHGRGKRARANLTRTDVRRDRHHPCKRARPLE